MENVTDTNEEIKRMAAFFAQQAYNEPILGHYVEYNNQEYIRIVSSHNNNSGFDGDVYLNTNTKQIIVTFRAQSLRYTNSQMLCNVQVPYNPLFFSFFK